MERWIDDGARLADELAGLGPGPLAVDTEADSFHHYEAKLCLVQLSFGDRDLLLDPLAGLDPVALAAPLADPRLRKVLHAADYDLRMLRRHWGLEVRGVFDTMIAARLCGERAFGLAALAHKLLGVTLDKQFQMADWSRRPLSAGMRAYAARDTRFLIELAARLARRLGELGRTSWAAEEFERLPPGRTGGEASRPAPYLRVKGASDLSRRELALLRGLADLRERAAQAADVAPFRIARDEVLTALARAATRGAAPTGAGFDRRVAAQVGPAVQAALALGEDAWPPPVEPARRPVLDPALETRVRRACAERDRLAAGLDLDPALIASRGQIEWALSAPREDGATSDPRALRTWQAELLGPVLRSLGG